MPYIKQEQRDAVEPFVADLARAIVVDAAENAPPLQRAGIVNYAITTLIQYALLEEGARFRYSDVVLITGVLENVKQEFYRRMAAPYEDVKAEENGDCYPV